MVYRGSVVVEQCMHPHLHQRIEVTIFKIAAVQISCIRFLFLNYTVYLCSKISSLSTSLHEIISPSTDEQITHNFIELNLDGLLCALSEGQVVLFSVEVDNVQKTWLAHQMVGKI